MNIADIVKQLKSERESLTKAIEALEGIEGGSQGVAKNRSTPATKAKAAKQPSNGQLQRVASALTAHEETPLTRRRLRSISEEVSLNEPDLLTSKSGFTHLV